MSVDLAAVDKDQKVHLQRGLQMDGQQEAGNEITGQQQAEVQTNEPCMIPEEEIAESEPQEEVNLVMIPRSRQGDPECVKAKSVELQKLKDWYI